MTTRRIDQHMATAAAAALPPAGTLKDHEKQALRTRYRQLGAMLQTAGLAATYAFISARSGSEKGALGGAYREAGRGIRKRLEDIALLPEGLDAHGVLAELGKMDAVKYARASAEAAALTRWLSRLADATYQTGQAG